MHIISFPGLGINDLNINKVAFTLFGKEIMWYGVIICIGMIIAVLYFLYRAGKGHLKFDSVIDYALVGIPFGIIGARLYYVIFSLKDHTYNNFIDVINLRNGGLAIYGGVIGGALAVFVLSKIKKDSFLNIADMVLPGVMIAQAIGRWGNFMNAEAYGTETTLPWRMKIETMVGNYRVEIGQVHPTFLYESLWNVIGFILINIFYRKKRYNGQIALEYCAWYGLGRMFIEGLRTDSLHIGNSDIRVSQVLALALFVFSFAALVVFEIRYRILLKREEIDKDLLVNISVLLGIKKVTHKLTVTGSIQYNTEELDRMDEIEEKIVEKRAKEKNPFEHTKEVALNHETLEISVSYEGTGEVREENIDENTIIEESVNDQTQDVVVNDKIDN